MIVGYFLENCKEPNIEDDIYPDLDSCNSSGSKDYFLVIWELEEVFIISFWNVKNEEISDHVVELGHYKEAGKVHEQVDDVHTDQVLHQDGNTDVEIGESADERQENVKGTLSFHHDGIVGVTVIEQCVSNHNAYENHVPSLIREVEWHRLAI
jgi:hypothetical protein